MGNDGGDMTTGHEDIGAIYAIKGSDSPEDVTKVYDALVAGEGRFGWSGVETADMRQLRRRVEASGWDSLSAGERNCYHPFLLDLKQGDYVVYVNVPEWGKCTLARVSGAYEWRWESDDFNHRFPVDPTTVRTFGRNDATVPANLSARLKLRGRWWRVYVREEFRASGRHARRRRRTRGTKVLANEPWQTCPQKPRRSFRGSRRKSTRPIQGRIWRS